MPSLAAGRRRKVLATAGWTLLFLALLDVALGMAFPYPASNRMQPGGLRQYFDYGRSIEEKVRRGIAANDELASPVAVAGWLGRECGPARRLESGPRSISFYGMSFSSHVANALERIDPQVQPIRYGGPAAPPNHSYACFLAQHDSGRDTSPVQVWGILASSVKGMLTMTGMSTSFEAPTPYTFPRYVLDADRRLQAITPLVGSPEELRSALTDEPGRWSAFTQQLSQNDLLYSRLLTQAGPWDRSVILRMLKRGYAQRESREQTAKWAESGGLERHPGVGPVLEAMVLDFASKTRAAGQLPVLLLLQDGNSGDSLGRWLGPMLDAHGIRYVSTHPIAPTSDPSNFVPDGHFTPAADARIAAKLREVIREETKQPSAP